MASRIMPLNSLGASHDQCTFEEEKQALRDVVVGTDHPQGPATWGTGGFCRIFLDRWSGQGGARFLSGAAFCGGVVGFPFSTSGVGGGA